MFSIPGPSGFAQRRQISFVACAGCGQASAVLDLVAEEIPIEAGMLPQGTERKSRACSRFGLVLPDLSFVVHCESEKN